MEWRRHNERLRFYEPNGKAEEFIKIVGSQDSPVYIYSAANGVGKSALVVNLFGSLLWPQANRFFDFKRFTDWTYPKRIRYITDPKLVEEIGPFHSEIEKWWPKGQYEALKAGKNYFSQYKSRDWVIDVMTYDQELKQFEGGTLGLIVFDEPPPQDIYHACVTRLRLGGHMIVAMTPLTGAAWFFDEVVPKHKDHIVYAQMEDACKEHGTRGHLEHKHIEAMISEMSPDEIEARAFGKALYLSGVIFKTFNPRVHVLEEPIAVPSNATIYQSVDPHSDKPFAAIWAFPDQNGDLYIIDEWPNQDFYKMHNCQLTIQDYRNIFADKEAGWNIHKRIIDRHFADVRSAVNKRTLREELRDDVGLDFYASYQATEEIETGILKVRSYLQYDQDKPISALNKPRLFISPHCENTIRSFQRWARDAKTGKVQDAYKDFMDCVRMLVMDSPEIDEPIPYEAPKKRWG